MKKIIYVFVILSVLTFIGCEKMRREAAERAKITAQAEKELIQNDIDILIVYDDLRIHNYSTETISDLQVTMEVKTGDGVTRSYVFQQRGNASITTRDSADLSFYAFYYLNTPLVKNEAEALRFAQLNGGDELHEREKTRNQPVKIISATVEFTAKDYSLSTTKIF